MPNDLKKNKKTDGSNGKKSKKSHTPQKKSQKISSRPVKLVRTIKEIRRHLKEARSKKRKIALVPTMGYLHDGHLSLIREAKKAASFVVATIFVNPTQFGPNEDLDRYPRDLGGDRKKLGQAGVDILFVPSTAEMYPEGYQTFVDLTDVTRNFCGASRPGHFRGVATVVCKLFHIINPDVAFFGEKDYQQLVAIRRMVEDLNMEIEIRGLPTIREEDGLAMSSRNAYLSPTQRNQATAIFRGLRKAKKLLDEGERDAAELTAIVLDLLREERDLDIEYVAVCDPVKLERIPEVERDAVLLVGVRVGQTRLIDNMRLTVKPVRARKRKSA